MATEEEDELDPALERVRGKLVRLLAVSFGVMMLGFVAVLVAVFYRISQDRAPREAVAVTLPIAPGALSAATATDDRLILTIGGDQPRIEVRDLRDGRLLATFALGNGDGAD